MLLCVCKIKPHLILGSELSRLQSGRWNTVAECLVFLFCMQLWSGLMLGSIVLSLLKAVDSPAGETCRENVFAALHKHKLHDVQHLRASDSEIYMFPSLRVKQEQERNEDDVVLQGGETEQLFTNFLLEGL